MRGPICRTPGRESVFEGLRRWLIHPNILSHIAGAIQPSKAQERSPSDLGTSYLMASKSPGKISQGLGPQSSKASRIVFLRPDYQSSRKTEEPMGSLPKLTTRDKDVEERKVNLTGSGHHIPRDTK